MLPRLKSEFWVQAFIRRCAVGGMSAAVLARGHAEAGPVFVVINHLDGLHHVLGPPPGPAYDDAGDRRFESLTESPVDWPAARMILERRTRNDPDIWIVEAEDRNGLAGLACENQ